MLEIMAHAAVEQNVAREKNGEWGPIPDPFLKKPTPCPSLKGGGIYGKGRCCYGYLKHCD